MGNVVKVRELGLERIVAVKMIHPSLLGDEETLNRFKREGIVLSQLNHPNLLRCFRFGLWKKNTPYIAMEYLEAEALSSLIATSPLAPDRLLRLAIQICQGMAHAHAAHVVHRDLKPSNIMILRAASNDEQVKILDFGLAGLLPDNSASSKQHLTQTGTVLGSVYYMSPEQCMGKKTDARSDVYAVGCVLYESLTGAPPLVADTPVGLMHLHTKEYPRALSQAVPHVSLPEGLNDVIMRAMAKDPDNRYQSMEDLGRALNLVATGKGSLVPRFKGEGSRPSEVSGAGRRRADSGWIALLVLAATLGATAFFLSWQKSLAPKPWAEHKPKTDAGELVSLNLLKTNGVAELKLDPDSIEIWIDKFGHRNLYDRVHAYCLLFRANRMTLDGSIDKINSDLDTIIAGRPPEDFDRQYQLFRACKDYLYLLRLKYGREKGLQMVVSRFGSTLVPEFLQRVKDENLDLLRWAGLFEEQLSYLNSKSNAVQKRSGRDALSKACCLEHMGKLTESERLNALTAFQKLGTTERRSIDMFVLFRSVLELNAPALVMDYAEQSRVNIGQFEEAFQAVCLNRLGKVEAAEDLLQDPALGDYRLPLRLWNSLSLDKERAKTIKQDLLRDFKERNHDPRMLSRAAYHFAKVSPQIGEAALENALSQLKSDDYREGFLSISQIAETLNHLGRPEQAQRFMDSRAVRRPKGFSCVWHEELLILLQYVRALRLQRKYSEAKLKWATLHELTIAWPAARRYLEGLVLAESARLERDSGNRAGADLLYAKAFDSATDKLEVGVVDKVIILEEHAKLCAGLGNTAMSAALKKQSDRLLWGGCRSHWTEWMPFCPDYPILRTIEDLE